MFSMLQISTFKEIPNRGIILTVSCKNIYEDIKSAIDLLHQNQYVFADLRLPNIIVVNKDGDQHAMLIDFDWTGKHKEDKYPSSINSKIEWPVKEIHGKLLDKSHDYYWLEKLKIFLNLQ